jgi:hypothetical protein
MHRYPTFVAAAILFILATGAFAASKVTCPRPETEAEQAVHFQIKLMVASSICTNTAYDDFVRNTLPAINLYLGQARRRHPGFDAYVTHLANEEGQAAGHQTVGEYCKAEAELFEIAAKLVTSEDFQHYMATQVAASASAPGACKK